MGDRNLERRRARGGFADDEQSHPSMVTEAERHAELLHCGARAAVASRTMPNVFDPEFEPDSTEPAPFNARGAEIGLQAGSRDLGASLYELPPGQAISPLHLHHNNEEMLIVLSGRPTLRTLDGERELATGEVVSFPAGREGAHRVDNHGAEPARVLMLSTMNDVDVVEYPDSGKVLARSKPRLPDGLPPGAFRLMVRASEGVDYYDGEL
jgi:uncharacterized cupin superfamily protein